MVYKAGVHGPGYYLTAATTAKKERSHRSATTDSEDPSDIISNDGAASPPRSAPATERPEAARLGAASTGKNRGGKSPKRGKSPNPLGGRSKDAGGSSKPAAPLGGSMWGAVGGADDGGALGMPTDLPEDAAKMLNRRMDKHGNRELAVPLGDGWMQRGGRGTFAKDVELDKGPPVLEISSSEQLFYVLTYDQNPDGQVTRSAHYKLETTLRCPLGSTVKDLQYLAIVLDWRRGRSTITAPCFTGVVISGACWRIEQYCEGQQRTLAEVYDGSLRTGTGLSMAAPWLKVCVEVKGDRVSVTCNKKPIFGSFMIPPPPDTSLAGGRQGGRSTALTGPVGIATYRSRAQIKSFELTPLDSPDGSSRGLSGEASGRTPRPAFTGAEPKLVELIEGEMLERSPNVAWDSIGGLESAKRLINEAVVLPLLIPEYFAAAACRSTWKGVLLFGPPGTGKTMLARAVASLGKTAFFNIAASSLVSHYHGESEKLVRTLFALARHHAPSVVFFDEVDALVSTRGMAGEHEASRRLKSELLMQMDGVGSAAAAAGVSAKDSMVMVLATSNKPWDLDEAMRRRLERRIYIPLPDEEARKQMLKIHLDGVTLDHGVSLDHLARLTEGYSGADLHLACRDASMMPMRRMVEGKEAWQIVELHEQGALEGELGLIDFESALSNTQPSVAPDELLAYAAWNKEYGVHGGDAGPRTAGLGVATPAATHATPAMRNGIGGASRAGPLAGLQTPVPAYPRFGAAGGATPPGTSTITTDDS